MDVYIVINVINSNFLRHNVERNVAIFLIKINPMDENQSFME